MHTIHICIYMHIGSSPYIVCIMVITILTLTVTILDHYHHGSLPYWIINISWIITILDHYHNYICILDQYHILVHYHIYIYIYIYAYIGSSPYWIIIIYICIYWIITMHAFWIMTIRVYWDKVRVGSG